MRRLNKFISDSGYCSRREADQYIAQGRVTVNGAEVGIGFMVSEMDRVEVDGERVGRKSRNAVYLICNKPVGITCTSEKSDKTNIIDFLAYKERIFPVGRLDKDSEGLIILTNDGDIVNKILRAGNNNPKEYIVTVDKPITPGFLKHMSEGVHILGTTTKPCKIVRKNDTTFIIYLTQGLNRQIRRMCQALDYKVTRLKRVKVMNLMLGNLEPGRWRYLTPEETHEMHALLAASSGTEEASNERKAKPAKPFFKKPKNSFSQHRAQGKPATTGRKEGKQAESKQAARPKSASSKSSTRQKTGRRGKP